MRHTQDPNTCALLAVDDMLTWQLACQLLSKEENYSQKFHYCFQGDFMIHDAHWLWKIVEERGRGVHPCRFPIMHAYYFWQSWGEHKGTNQHKKKVLRGACFIQLGYSLETLKAISSKTTRGSGHFLNSFASIWTTAPCRQTCPLIHPWPPARNCHRQSSSKDMHWTQIVMTLHISNVQMDVGECQVPEWFRPWGFTLLVEELKLLSYLSTHRNRQPQ